MLSFFIKYYKSICWLCLFYILAGVNVYFYNEPLADTITYRYFCVNIIVVLIFLFAVEYNNKIKWCRIDSLMILVFLYLFFHTIFKNLVIEELIRVLYPFIIYFSVRFIIDKSSNNVYLILFPFILLSFVESCVGILQYFEIIEGATFFKVVGTFSNPTRLAGFLLITFPLFRLYKSKLYNNIITMLMVLNLFTILLTGNRAAILGVVVLIIYYSLKYNRNRISVKNIVFIIIFLFTVFILLLLYKKDSALGRLFIWKICIIELCEYFFFGSGINTFISIYNNAQGEYFSSNKIVDVESYNANFVAYPYNDFLMIVIEFGLPLLFLLLYLFLYIVRCVDKNKLVLFYMKLSLIGMFVYSMFSYVFKVPILLEMAVIIYASVVTIENNMKYEYK